MMSHFPHQHGRIKNIEFCFGFLTLHLTLTRLFWSGGDTHLFTHLKNKFMSCKSMLNEEYSYKNTHCAFENIDPIHKQFIVCLFSEYFFVLFLLKLSAG